MYVCRVLRGGVVDVDVDDVVLNSQVTSHRVVCTLGAVLTHTLWTAR